MSPGEDPFDPGFLDAVLEHPDHAWRRRKRAAVVAHHDGRSVRLVRFTCPSCPPSRTMVAEIVAADRQRLFIGREGRWGLTEAVADARAPGGPRVPAPDNRSYVLLEPADLEREGTPGYCDTHGAVTVTAAAIAEALRLVRERGRPGVSVRADHPPSPR